MMKDLGKAIYWVAIVFIACAIVTIGLNIIFSIGIVFLGVIFAPMLLTKAAASGAEVESSDKPKTDTSNAYKFNVMK